MPVLDFDTMPSKRREVVKHDVDEKYQVNQVNILKTGQGRKLLKRELVRNENAADNNQQQNQAVPCQTEAGKFSDYDIGQDFDIKKRPWFRLSFK